MYMYMYVHIYTYFGLLQRRELQLRGKPEIIRKRVRDLLGFMYMLIKFNSHAVDEPVMNEIIR